MKLKIVVLLKVVLLLVYRLCVVELYQDQIHMRYAQLVKMS